MICMKFIKQNMLNKEKIILSRRSKLKTTKITDSIKVFLMKPHF